MVKVEMEICEAQEKLHIIPPGAAKLLKQAEEQHKIKLERAKEIERETKHDVMAMVRAIGEAVPEAGAYIHVGATSQDINDTVTAVQLRDFLPYLFQDLIEVQTALMEVVKKHAGTVMLGRTHGQHASPITFGLKMSVFLSEIDRHLERLMESSRRFVVGKFMGPVGTGGFLGSKSMEVQAALMKKLQINAEENPTQLVNRDRYLEFLSIIALITVTLEKFATEIRNLQRPEIMEVAEAFDEKNQVGSSAMPSKTNPVDSENVCSLARFIRSLIVPEYESSIQWHERDLTNSASERFVLPYSCILIDHICRKSANIIKNLKVYPERMKSNLDSDPLAMSEAIVRFIWNKGASRQDAHEVTRKAAMLAINTNASFVDSLRDSLSKMKLSSEGLSDAFNPELFLGVSSGICSDTVERTLKIRRAAEKFLEEKGWRTI